MKKTKKVLSVVLALVMVLSMAIVAAADGTKGSITVKNPNGNTYTAYKIFDVSYNSERTAYSYTVSKTSEWFDVVASVGAETGAVSSKIDGLSFSSLGDGLYAVSFDEDVYDPAEFAETLNKNTKGKTGVALTDQGDGSVAATGLDLGYYFVTSSLGTLCSLTTTDNEVEITEKNNEPTVEKKIVDALFEGDNYFTGEKSTTASIGDTVTFATKITPAKGAENYVLHDKMDPGLTLGEVKVISYDASGLTDGLAEGTDYTIAKNTKDGCTFEVIFTASGCAKMENLVGISYCYVVYTATVNKDAVCGSEGNKNITWLTYGKEDKATEKSETTVYTYSFDLVKTDENGKVITGAEFKLYADSDCLNEIALVSTGDNAYRVATAEEKAADGFTPAVIEAGQVTISGLGNGTYYIKETKAPDGYNKLVEPKEVVVNDGNLTATVEDDTYVSGGVQVINKTGSILPSTGGIGTTIFYIVGAALILVAAVLLIIRRRKSIAEK